MNPQPASGPTLRDIHLPPSPPWWPPAPGWWIVLALLALLLVALAWWWRGRRWLRRRRQQWLRELEQLARQHARDGDVAALSSGVQQLLRRVARQHESEAAGQRGAAWQRTLARLPVEPLVVTRLSLLDAAIYRPQAGFDVPAVLAAARTWLAVAARPRAWRARKGAKHV